LATLLWFAYRNTGSIPIHSTQLLGSDQKSEPIFACPLASRRTDKRPEGPFVGWQQKSSSNETRSGAVRMKRSIKGFSHAT
jgi:hypothetical protein